jgi:hypothetical protein
MDELTRLVLTKLALPCVVPIPLHLVELRNDPLAKARRQRNYTEYCWTLTSTVTAWILQTFREVDLLTYLDADLFFFSSPDPMFEELGDDSILIHEHRYSPDIRDAMEGQFGKYNVGLLMFRNSRQGRPPLELWRDQCLDWCFSRMEEGKYGDQYYLNDWPSRYEAVHVLQHIGGGVAPWNQNQHDFTCQGGEVLVDGMPLIFYHFHSLKIFTHNIVMPVLYPQYNPVRTEVLCCCIIPYLEALFSMARIVQNKFGDVHFGILKDEPLPIMTTLVVPLENFDALTRTIALLGREFRETDTGTPGWKSLVIMKEDWKGAAETD